MIRRKRRVRGEPDAERPQTLKSVIKAHKWEVIGSLLGLLALSVGWYFGTCVTERRQEVKEFKQVIATHRIADEKLVQDISAIVDRMILFDAQLRGGIVVLREVERSRNEIRSLIQHADADCNAAKDAWYRYTIRRRNIAQLFFLPQLKELDVSPECAELAKAVAWVGALDAYKLAHDQKYRAKFLAGGEQSWEQYRRAQELSQKVMQAGNQKDREVVEHIEVRSSNLLKSLWDCLRGSGW